MRERTYPLGTCRGGKERDEQGLQQTHVKTRSDIPNPTSERGDVNTNLQDKIRRESTYSTDAAAGRASGQVSRNLEGGVPFPGRAARRPEYQRWEPKRTV